MNELKTAFAHPWSICLPTVVRYLEPEYVDQFFSDGTIWLSSFKKFRQHSDEQRRDLYEGRMNMEIKSPNARHVAILMNGQEAYVLSTSTVESKGMKASFQTDSGFRITNTLAFAECISRQIPGFVCGLQGLCSYRDNTMIQKKSDVHFKPPEATENMEKWSSDYDLFIREQSREGFLVKATKYSHQGEYRFVWFAQGNEKECIQLHCPEAVKFCERLE